MKKIIVGLVMGVVLTLSASVLANSAWVGKFIQGTFPVYLNGERLEQDAIISEGTSFLPVRLLAEKLGLEVTFENETIFLSKQENNNVTQQENEQEASQTEEGDGMEQTFYEYHSDVLDLWFRDGRNQLRYLVKDENVYVPISIFYNYQVSFSRKSTVYEFPNGVRYESKNFEPTVEYEPGIDAYVGDGGSYIKLSVTGYNAEIRDGAVWIVE